MSGMPIVLVVVIGNGVTCCCDVDMACVLVKASAPPLDSLAPSTPPVGGAANSSCGSASMQPRMTVNDLHTFTTRLEGHVTQCFVHMFRHAHFSDLNMNSFTLDDMICGMCVRGAECLWTSLWRLAARQCLGPSPK